MNEQELKEWKKQYKSRWYPFNLPEPYRTRHLTFIISSYVLWTFHLLNNIFMKFKEIIGGKNGK